MRSLFDRIGAMPDRTFVLAGWWLFVLCAVLFVIAAWRAGDPLALAGSVAFLSANALFMVPVYRHAPAANIQV